MAMPLKLESSWPEIVHGFANKTTFMENNLVKRSEVLWLGKVGLEYKSGVPDLVNTPDFPEKGNWYWRGKSSF